jgi:23S rRNA (cytidine1920-2'-O)/16S rRNA (cytidine1409-2'-O)-methyltransferase
VLLQKQIEKVYAIDVGHNQLDWVVRSDPRVQVFEGTNARYLEFSQIGEKVQLLVADVSFISLEKILPNICQFAQLQTDWITLIKPQFEVGQHKVGKGGVVKSEEDRLAAVDRITSFCKNLGLTRYGLMASPIVGANGNQEFLAHWRLN